MRTWSITVLLVLGACRHTAPPGPAPGPAPDPAPGTPDEPTPAQQRCAVLEQVLDAANDRFVAIRAGELPEEGGIRFWTSSLVMPGAATAEIAEDEEGTDWTATFSPGELSLTSMVAELEACVLSRYTPLGPPGDGDGDGQVDRMMWEPTDEGDGRTIAVFGSPDLVELSVFSP
jgi:hypothetical protein